MHCLSQLKLKCQYVILPILIFLLLTNQNTLAQNSASNIPLKLKDVKYWGYQIQSIDEQGAVDSLVNSGYDMIVLEPTRTDWSSDTKNFNTAQMVSRIKKSPASDGIHRKLVFAYIDIGEAEDWRWYWTWSQDWNCTSQRPADWPNFIITCDPDGWTGNYPVAYWDSLWQDIVIWGRNQSGIYTSIIDEVLLDGFDGIYLDWVEAFEDSNVIVAAKKAGKNPAEEMIAFINDMRNYAKKRAPDFLIIQQNAASLCKNHSELFTAIDAIAQEAIWYDGIATDDWKDIEGHDRINDNDQTTSYINLLNQYLGAGIPVFNCEYALAYSDSAYQKSYDNGYIPYVTRRSLGKLTTTPPPEYHPVSIKNKLNKTEIKNFSLKQNYPNPFNPTTVIEYSVPSILTVILKVFNVLGEEVATLVNKQQRAGNYKVVFNNAELNSGIYFYKLTAGKYSSVKKMLLLR